MISLSKGQTIDLVKDGVGIQKLEIGLGWNAKMDLDMLAVLVDENDKLIESICYKDEKNRNNSVRLLDDDVVGGTGENEIIQIDLDRLHSDIKKIAIYVNIFKFFGLGKKKFSDVEDAHIKVINRDSNEEIAKYDLDENEAGFDACHFADIVNCDGTWKLMVVLEGCSGSVDKLSKTYK